MGLQDARHHQWVRRKPQGSVRDVGDHEYEQGELEGLLLMGDSMVRKAEYEAMNFVRPHNAARMNGPCLEIHG